MVAPAAWNCNYTWFEWTRLVFLIALDMIAGSTIFLLHCGSAVALWIRFIRDPHICPHLIVYIVDYMLPLILLVMMLAAINYLVAPPPALAWFLAKLDALDKKAAT
jgi:hypothetical protein